MNNEPISPALKRFILSCFTSVNQLEVFLLLVASPEKLWTAKSSAIALRMDDRWTEGTLKTLAARKLVRNVSGPEVQYHFKFENDPLSKMATELATVYRSHRLRVIDIIFSRRDDALKDFAEAFCLVKNQDGDLNG